MPIKEKPIKRQDGEEQNNGQRMNGESIKGNNDDLSEEQHEARRVYEVCGTGDR